MRSTLLKLVLVFSLSMNVAVVAAFSYQRACGAGDAPGDRDPGADPFAALELSPRQQREIDRLRAQFRDYRGQCHRQMGGMREALVEELTSDIPDQEAIARTLIAMRDRQAATQQRFVDYLLELRAVLRADQRRELDRVLERTLLGSRCSDGDRCPHAIHE